MFTSLLTRRQESFSRIIEAKQVPVLREEFADGYVALFCRHRLGRDGAALWLFTCFVDVRHICVLFHFAGLYFGTHDETCSSHGSQHQDPRSRWRCPSNCGINGPWFTFPQAFDTRGWCLAAALPAR